MCRREKTQIINTQGKDCNKISPILGYVAATARPKEAAGFFQLWVGVGMREANTPRPGTGRRVPSSLQLLGGTQLCQTWEFIKKLMWCGYVKVE